MNRRFLIFPFAAALSLAGFLIASRMIDSGAMPQDKAAATVIALALVLGGPFLLAVLASIGSANDDKHDIAQGGDVARQAKARQQEMADSNLGWILMMGGMIVGGIILMIAANGNQR